MVRTLLEFYFYDFIIMKGLDHMVVGQNIFYCCKF
jgi:hypothetical protein